MTISAPQGIPFLPCGNSIRIDAVTPTAPAAVQVPLFAAGGNVEITQAVQMRIRISGSQVGDVSIGYGASAAEAINNAAAFPTAAGTGTKSIQMSAGTIELFTFTAGTFFTALSSAGTIQVHLTPGGGY